MARIGKCVVLSICLGLFGVSACSSEFESLEEGGVSASEEELGRPVACASSAQCKPTEFCTTEIGVCNRPPGCRPGRICPAVCYGTCRPRVECRSDRDCRTFSDYCTGCDCRALANGEPDPVCPGPGVQCFVDPCLNQTAVCEGGQCVLAGAR